MFSIGSFIILFDEQGRVLLCHRRDLDLWNLPGGGMQSGELPTEAAVREAREETGLEVVIERLVGVYGKADKDELVFAFTGRVIGGRLLPTDEADECRYYAVDAIPANTPPKHVERVHDALLFATQPVFRLQTALSSLQWLQSLQTKGDQT